jgi:hypothetical protein
MPFSYFRACVAVRTVNSEELRRIQSGGRKETFAKVNDNCSALGGVINSNAKSRPV